MLKTPPSPTPNNLSEKSGVGFIFLNVHVWPMRRQDSHGCSSICCHITTVTCPPERTRGGKADNVLVLLWKWFRLHRPPPRDPWSSLWESCLAKGAGSTAIASIQTQVCQLWPSSHSSWGETNRKSVQYVRVISAMERKTNKKGSQEGWGMGLSFQSQSLDVGEGSVPSMWIYIYVQAATKTLNMPRLQGMLQHNRGGECRWGERAGAGRGRCGGVFSAFARTLTFALSEWEALQVYRALICSHFDF